MDTTAIAVIEMGEVVGLQSFSSDYSSKSAKFMASELNGILFLLNKNQISKKENVNWKRQSVRGKSRKKSSEQLKKRAPPGSLFALHPSGWIQMGLFTQWFDHFLEHTKPTQESPILLLLDEHHTHTRNLDVILKAKEHFVSIICWPPHTTHKMQPLDKTVMGALKTDYSEEVRVFMRTTNRSITHFDICELFGNAYLKIQTGERAAKVYSATGIYPVKRNIFSEQAFIAEIALKQKEKVVRRIDDDTSGPSGIRSMPKKICKRRKPTTSSSESQHSSDDNFPLAKLVGKKSRASDQDSSDDDIPVAYLASKEPNSDVICIFCEELFSKILHNAPETTQHNPGKSIESRQKNGEIKTTIPLKFLGRSWRKAVITLKPGGRTLLDYVHFNFITILAACLFFHSSAETPKSQTKIPKYIAYRLVFRQGDKGKCWYAVMSGSVEVRVSRSDTADPKTQILTTKKKQVLRNKISNRTKGHMIKSSVHSCFLYDCEVWTLNARLRNRTVENRYYRRCCDVTNRYTSPTNESRKYSNRRKEILIRPNETDDTGKITSESF
ncbi:unnamed protein product [Acanthoscelides obtectus]|uniref:Cyclic nucleotide-binding domain-containing protein n=1 Tax=Acanthoscelides obtectus TaxID=200917 RepID=A0A9P0PV15_ACAOB|nr:unnamed protein product [Acanthoscelides obtectus]CAK1621487.1 hypothetical protein AOBTE_LOCUS989 [Acanthoscelides obtectus]